MKADRDVKPRRPADAQNIKERLAGLCARSEQCSFDLMKKMRSAGLSDAQAHNVLEELERLKFVDDCRYAKSLARDKVRFSAWGNYKIRQYLASKRIPNVYIDEAIAGIDAKDYKEALIRATRAKIKTLDIRDPEDYAKLLRHLSSKGFEMKYAVSIADQLLQRLKR